EIRPRRAALGQALEPGDDADERALTRQGIVDAIVIGRERRQHLTGPGTHDDRPTARSDDLDHVLEQRAAIDVEPGLVLAHARRGATGEDQRAVHAAVYPGVLRSRLRRWAPAPPC